MLSFNKIVISLVGVAALVVATPVNVDSVELEHHWDHIASPLNAIQGSCNVGTAQCCQSIHQTNDQSFQMLSSLLGLAIPADNLMAGIQCSPIANLADVLSGSSTCNSQPICCTGNSFSGLVNLGCSPLSL